MNVGGPQHAGHWRSDPGAGRARLALLAAGCVLVLAGFGAPCLAMTDDQIGRLVILDDQPVLDAFVDRVTWLGDGQRMIVGGWEEWPKSPLVLAVQPDGAVTPVVDGPANPFFAVAPDGVRVACWRKLGTGDAAQLAVTTPGRASVTPLGSPVALPQAQQVLWSDAPGGADQGCIAYALSEPEDKGGLYVVSPRGDAPRKLLQITAGWWAGLFAADNPEDLIAGWWSKRLVCWRVNPRTGLYASVDAFWGRARPRPGLGPAAWLDDKKDVLVANRPDVEPTRLVNVVDGFCWAPSGRALAYWWNQTLWVVSVEGRFKRKLLGMVTLPAPGAGYRAHGCAWSPDESSLVYWRNGAGRGTLRRASLGTEEVSIRVAVPTGTQLPKGSSVWVAEKFIMAGPGVIEKPVWPTCKGLFKVTGQADEGGQVVVNALNAGTEAGIVRRLTGSNDPPAQSSGAGHIAIGVGGVPTPVVRTFSVKALPTVAAWPQGSKTAWRLLSVDVTRRGIGGL